MGRCSAADDLHKMALAPACFDLGSMKYFELPILHPTISYEILGSQQASL